MRESCSVQWIKTYQLVKSNLPCVWHCMEFHQEGFGLYCCYWQITCIKPVHWKDLRRRQFWHSAYLYWCYFSSEARCFSLSSFRTSLTVFTRVILALQIWMPSSRPQSYLAPEIYQAAIKTSNYRLKWCPVNSRKVDQFHPFPPSK